MLNLYDHLDKFDDKHLVMAIDKKQFTKLYFTKLIQSKKSLLSKLKGLSIAVCYAKQVSLALLLPLLDGNVKSILLLPSNASADLIQQHMQLLGVDMLLTDRALEIEGFFCGDFFTTYSLPIRESAEKFTSTVWAVPTSGTTGTPKLVKHTLSSLTKTIKIDSGRGSDFCWSSFYDISRFAGLQVFLQAFCSGSLFVLFTKNDILSEGINYLLQWGCNALSATPTMWRKILMTPGSERLALKQITLGGEIADQRILSALEKSYPSARIIHLYASTEMGVCFSVTDRREGFPAAFIQNPPRDIKMKVINGLLYLKHAKYKPEYVDLNKIQISGNGFINTGDFVKREQDRFIFLGRESGTINVGGDKVLPEEIERVLLAVEGVIFARVIGRKNSILGELVEAHVVPEKNIADLNALKKKIHDSCKKKLPPYKVPAIIKIVGNININDAGKMERLD